jgi:hypothetical protein
MSSESGLISALNKTTILVGPTMKKIVLLLVTAMAMASCVLNPTYKEYYGSRVEVIQVSVKAEDWKYTQIGTNDQFNNNYFYAGIEMPELTQEVFDKGEVKAYLVMDRHNANDARKHLLPYVLHVEEVYQNEWIFYTQTIDFTYGIGWAEVNFRMSDFAYEEDVTINPTAMEFDIVITYPEENEPNKR